MELPKETIERIEKEARKYATTLVDEIDGTPQFVCYLRGAKSEALRSLSEIEKLKEDKREALKLVESIEKNIADLRLLKSKYENKCFQLESQNKELMEALSELQNVLLNEGYVNTAGKIESLLKSLPNKEA
jgi:hypothetical protein